MDRAGGTTVVTEDSRAGQRVRDLASGLDRGTETVAGLALLIELAVAGRLSRWRLRAVQRWAEHREARPGRQRGKPRPSVLAYAGVVVVVLGAAAQTPNQHESGFGLATGTAALVSGAASLAGVLVVLGARRRGDLVGMALFFVVVAIVMTCTRGAHDGAFGTPAVLAGLVLQVAAMVVGVRGMRGARPSRGDLDEEILERMRPVLAAQSAAGRAATRAPAVDAVRILYERRQVDAVEAERLLRELLRSADVAATR